MCWAPLLNSNTWCNFTVFKVLTLCCFLFAVRYSSNLLTKRNHFGHIGGVDFNLLFSLQKTIPAFTRTNEERQARLIKGTASTLRELILDGRFESNYRLFKKPVFLAGDAIKKNEEVLFDGNYKWLRQIGERHFFLPNMEWMFPLSYMQSISLPRCMDWDFGQT